MSWFKAHSGISTDNKFLLVARSTGQDGARISGVWLAMLDHANGATPRGNIESFDIESYAVWASLDEAVVRSIVNAMGPKPSGGVGLHDGRMILRWRSRQGKDPTGAERQRRHRQKMAAQQADEAADSTLRNVTSRTVTLGPSPYRQTERSDVCPHTSTSSDSSTSSDTSRDDACASAMSAGEVWAALEQAGVSIGFLGRGRHSATVRDWLARGLTRPEFNAAVDRARAARQRSNAPEVPLNVGFLNAVITNPIEPVERSVTRSYADGDAVSRNFARG